MEIRIQTGDFTTVGADPLVLFHFEQDDRLLEVTGAVNDATDSRIGGVIEAGDFRGEHLEHLLLFPQGSRTNQRILLMGLGGREEFTAHRLRDATAQALRILRERRQFRARLPIPTDTEFPLSLEDAAEACVLGGMLGQYQFTDLRTRDRDKIKRFESLTIFSNEETQRLTGSVHRAKAIAEGIYLARDLVTLPANLATPTLLAERAKSVADQAGMHFHMIEVTEAKELGMGAFLAVARGSDEPGIMVVMDYQPSGEEVSPVLLVGKGITFDSGGISIKPAKDMEKMKHDMAGAAAVIGTMQAVASLNLPLRVVALIPCTENLPSGKAYKPGDVIRSLSGLTIEVINTDAEGRMVLADALTYADRYKPQAIIDLATLTGACIVALGNEIAGLLGNDEELLARIKAAGEESGEKVWPLPLWDRYFDLLKSDVADFRNVDGRKAGAITAAIFLKQFVPDGTPWAHLDIAGCVWEEKDRPLTPKGATGMGVHLLTRLLQDWQPLSRETG
ncbi:MAG: leucyl aminopeptidase [Deltaproteobacteria bacterium]|nr:MAG: leucyl aminopeptidase [Deltaproteobacteria bacterium]